MHRWKKVRTEDTDRCVHVGVFLGEEQSTYATSKVDFKRQAEIEEEGLWSCMATGDRLQCSCMDVYLHQGGGASADSERASTCDWPAGALLPPDCSGESASSRTLTATSIVSTVVPAVISTVIVPRIPRIASRTTWTTSTTSTATSATPAAATAAAATSSSSSSSSSSATAAAAATASTTTTATIQKTMQR
ncbi:hypothetical protein EYF80_005170 [Liparis tanakae]|uniref:Uncharacterized protein n=1 Tax=Liparis tanakae TaxID=230148 RepID=A0A4Z2J2P2_9TELE|nr:hypothetical protein EYF80_005170 [Liparis tanakae]